MSVVQSRSVFISYSSQDREVAQAVCDTLEANGLACWIAPRNIVPGSNWSHSIIEGIESSRVMVLIFSAHSNESPQVANEVERAVHKRLALLPFRIEDVPLSPHMEYFISSRHWLDALASPLEPYLEHLVEAVRVLLNTPPAADLSEAVSPTLASQTPRESLPERPAELPSVRSQQAVPNNLPQQLTSFIGREKEIAEITALVKKTRLLTLTGAGGCGKTRLSLRVAAELMEQFSDGVWLVELAPLADSALVPQTVAQVFALRERVGQSIQQTLLDDLKSKRLLLVLDNCEHLLSACVQLADALLRACPQVKILSTSREALGTAGEQIYRVPSLSLPDPKERLTLEQVSQYEAVRLFIERATSSKPDFAPTAKNASTLAILCHRLDGIPLAIELAAARVRSLSVEEIDSRLDNRFRLLTGGSKTALPRQQTLRGLIDWSYDLLNGQEKRLLARLSAFAGGWMLEAAEQVGMGESADGESIEDWEVLDLLTSLTDKSLVIAEVQEETTRYRMLETVRQYALERLKESGERDEVRARHRNYFLGLAEKADLHLNGAEQRHWLEVLEAEHDNLRQALSFCLEETTKGGELGLCLGAALQQFWRIRGHLSEGRQHLTAMLSHPGGAEPPKVRADALNAAGNLARIQGDNTTARTLLEESLALRRELGDKRGIAVCLVNLGLAAQEQGDYANARTLLEESLALRREIGDKHGIASCLNNLGLVAQEQGDYAAARALLEESLAIDRELGDKHGTSASLKNLGLLVHNQGDYATARVLQEESLAIDRELGDKRGIAVCLVNLGNVACAQSDYATARSLYEESLMICRELEYKGGVAYCLINLGSVAREQGDYEAARALHEESMGICRQLEYKLGIAYGLDAFASLAHQDQQDQRAARLWGAATALREVLGAPRTPHDHQEYEQELATIRSALDEAAFAAASEEGRAMTWEQAVAYALEDTDM